MKKYKHIIFDVDGTLLDTGFAVLHSLQDTVLRYLNECIPMDELTFALGIPGEVTLQRLGIEDVGGANKYWNECMQKYRSCISLFDGVCEMLEALHREGYALGIITSKTKEEYEADFVPYGVSRYFGSVVCVEDSSRPKPYPDPLLAYLDRNGVSAEEAVYIGDTIYDSQCARSAGVDFGLALWGCSKPDGIDSKHKFQEPNVIAKEYGK